MPRSPPASSSDEACSWSSSESSISEQASAGSTSAHGDDVDVDSGSSDHQPAAHADAAGSAAPRASGATPASEPFGPHKPSALYTNPIQAGRIDWFRRRVIYQLCVAYLESQLYAQGHNYRSNVQRVSSFRRRSSGMQPHELLELLRPQLLEPAASSFPADLQHLQRLMDEPILPNDMGWILGRDGEGQPPKALLVQKLQTLLARHLQQALHYPAAANLAMSLVDILANAWYQELLLTIWPLLGQEGQRDLQQWFWRYTNGSAGEHPAREATQNLVILQPAQAMSRRVVSEVECLEPDEPGDFSTRQGRPGPKSGGSRIIVLTCNQIINTIINSSGRIADIGAWADVRVGGWFGQAPPGARQHVHTTDIGVVKLHGPQQNCMHSQATGIQLAQLMCRISHASQAFPLSRVHALPEISSRISTHVPSRNRLRSRTGLRFSRDAACCLMPGLWWSTNTLIGLCRRQPKHPGTFFPTRVLTGVFRRRPGIHPRTRCLKRLHSIAEQHDGVQHTAGYTLNLANGSVFAQSAHPLSLGSQQPQPSRVNASGAGCRTQPSTGGKGRLLQIITFVLLKPAASVRQANSATPSTGDTLRPAASAGLLHAHGTTALRLTPCQKPSFKRAQVRVTRDGQTTYRGQLHTPASLSLANPGRPHPPRRHTPNTGHNPSPSDNFYRVLTWNCGGLNALRYRELVEWLQQLRQHTPVDIVCIQETRWKDCSEFSSEDWNCVHSGAGAAHAGVLFMIHRSVAPVASIRFNHLVPGRVMHIRIETNPAVDLLGAYQHAWNLQSNPHNLSLEQRTQDLLRHRAGIRDVIGSWTRSIPKRNSLMILGDFNAALAEHKPNIGPGTQPHAQPHPDQADFQSLIVSAGLNALNTWGRSGNKAGTFVMHTGTKVQIDFMFSRLPCEPRLLAAATVPEAPVIHPTGFRHIPVMGFLRKPAAPRESRTSPKVQPRQIQQALTLDPGLHQRFRDAVQQQLPSSDSLHACLQSAWNRVAPKPAARLLTSQRSGHSLKEYWQAKQQLRQSMEPVNAYRAPVMYYIAHCTTVSILHHFPCSLQTLKPI